MFISIMTGKKTIYFGEILRYIVINIAKIVIKITEQYVFHFSFKNFFLMMYGNVKEYPDRIMRSKVANSFE
jgi:hypothetical protein